MARPYSIPEQLYAELVEQLAVAAHQMYAERVHEAMAIPFVQLPHDMVCWAEMPFSELLPEEQAWYRDRAVEHLHDIGADHRQYRIANGKIVWMGKRD